MQLINTTIYPYELDFRLDIDRELIHPGFQHLLTVRSTLLLSLIWKVEEAAGGSSLALGWGGQERVKTPLLPD